MTFDVNDIIRYVAIKWRRITENKVVIIPLSFWLAFSYQAKVLVSGYFEIFGDY